jgi:predicted PurR-regulated permease PerM
MTEHASTSDDPKWDLATRYIVGVLLVLFFIVLLYAIRAEVAVVLISAIVAYLVNPIIGSLCKRLGLSKGLAVLLTYIGVLVAILLTIVILIPAVVRAIADLVSIDWSAAFDSLLAWLDNGLNELASIDFPIDAVNQLVDSIVTPLINVLEGADSVKLPGTMDTSTALGTVGKALGSGFSVVTRVLGGAIGAIVSFALMMVFAIYMSLQSEKLHPALLKTIPERYRGEVDTLVNRLNAIWHNYLRGEVTLMLIIGSIVAVGNFLLGNRGAIFLGIISGLMEVVPGIGPALALIPGVTVALVGGSSHLPFDNLVFALIVAAFYELVQVFENNVILPRVMGRAVELNPLVVLVGMFAAARLIGLLGAIITVPALASGIEVARYLYLKTLGEEPFPPEPEGPEDAGASWRDSARAVEARAAGVLHRRGSSASDDDVAPTEEG